MCKATQSLGWAHSFESLYGILFFLKQRILFTGSKVISCVDPPNEKTVVVRMSPPHIRCLEETIERFPKLTFVYRVKFVFILPIITNAWLEDWQESRAVQITGSEVAETPTPCQRCIEKELKSRFSVFSQKDPHIGENTSI